MNVSDEAYVAANRVRRELGGSLTEQLQAAAPVIVQDVLDALVVKIEQLRITKQDMFGDEESVFVNWAVDDFAAAIVDAIRQQH